jgi:nucleotide-binding universal stress UspA family protein
LSGHAACDEHSMHEIQRILCPVDVSDTTTHVVDQATALAAWTHAGITALHVYEPMIAPVPGLPEPNDRVPTTQLQSLRDHFTAAFQGAVAQGIAVDIMIEVGQPVPHILGCAAGVHADIIVMGTHGAGGFEHLLLGSVAETVLRKARCPVLTVPPRAHSTSRLPFERLLCAVDFSEASLAAARFACATAKETGAALTLAHVVEWPWHEPPAAAPQDMPPAQGAALAEYRRYLQSTATTRLASLGREHACVSEPVVVHGKSYAEILRLAEEERADLIVLGVRGRNPLDMMLLGSTTNHVVRRATCPVLTVRDDSERQ